MKNIAIIRKVPFKMGKRLVWSLIVAESHGLSLLLIKKSDEQGDHALVLAQENVEGRYFEDAKANRFFLSHQDLAEIGDTLGALGAGLSRDDLDKFFESHNNWLEE